jgi:hypothetical protein
MKSIEKSLKALSMSKSGRVKAFILLWLFAAVFIFQTVLAEETKGAKDGYVGSKGCKKCHEEMYIGWENTLHSKVVQNVKENPYAAQGDFTSPDVKEYLQKHEVTHTIGSHWDQRYLTKIKDEYYIFPFSWSIVTKRWVILNNFEAKYWKRMPYSKYCIGCHTTNYNPEDKSYSEHRIGCEACHGPGEEHVKSEGDISLTVNPAKLSEVRSDMICAACHVKGEDKSGTYTFPIGFKPGENLADYMSVTSILHEEGETAEDVIVRVFNNWKEQRKSPKSCDVCGINKPKNVAPHVNDSGTSTDDFCFGCHDFKDKLNEHTHHLKETDMICSDCHKIKEEEAVEEERNIHSYGYYLIHRKGCYDPLIEKYCLKCHKDKTKGWATSHVIDWAVPPDFIVHDE